MIGLKFNRITVIGSKVKKPEWFHWKWQCLCDCGASLFVTGTQLKNGNTKSCGCLSIDLLKARSTTHGMTGTRIFQIWFGMLDRCGNPNNRTYNRYKNFAPPERWRVFENFYEDMGDPPPGMSIDRRDNEKGYSKENCRWATPSQQTGNTRRSIPVILGDERVCLKEACMRTGMPYHRTLKRVRKGADVYQELGIERPTSSAPQPQGEVK